MEIVFFYWVYRPCNSILWLVFSNIGCAAAKLMLNIIFTAHFHPGESSRGLRHRRISKGCVAYITSDKKRQVHLSVWFCTDFWRHCAVETAVSPEVWIGFVTSRPRVEWLRCVTRLREVEALSVIICQMFFVLIIMKLCYFFSFRKGVRVGEYVSGWWLLIGLLMFCRNWNVPVHMGWFHGLGVLGCLTTRIISSL